MTHDTAQHLIDALDDLLDDEKQALIAGDLEKVTRLAQQKESLIEELNQLETREEFDIGELQGKVARNQDLLNSAMEGIRAVASRMAAMRKVRRSLDTYDRDGKKHSIVSSDAPTVERRA